MIANAPLRIAGDTASDAAKTGQAVYIIYGITRKEDSKQYVGLTRRPLAERIKAHVHDAMRRRRNSSPGSLANAIRQKILCGYSFEAAFDVQVLAEGLTADQAREAEILWVERLHAYAPKGFNILPPGGSIGGPANAHPTVIQHPRRGKLNFPSVSAAIEFRNRELAELNNSLLEVGTVYARLLTGWPIEEALGYLPHTDRRTLRKPFFAKGRVLRRLREVAEATGLSIAALRSRLHRAARRGLNRHDVGHDRRRSARRRPAAAHLPHPSLDGSGRNLTIKAFSALSGVPKSTIAYRYQQLENPGSMSDEDIVLHLCTPQERRRIVTLDLPDGTQLRGGERETIRMLLSNRRFAWSRPEPIGESAIRRRLRLVRSNEGPLVAWAFGLAPDQCPRRPVGGAAPESSTNQPG